MSVQFIIALFVHLLNEMTAVCKQTTQERSTFCIKILWNVLQCLVTDIRLTEIVVCQKEWLFLYFDNMTVAALCACVFCKLFIYWVTVFVTASAFYLWNIWIWHGNGMTVVKIKNNKGNVTNIRENLPSSWLKTACKTMLKMVYTSRLIHKELLSVVSPTLHHSICITLKTNNYVLIFMLGRSIFQNTPSTITKLWTASVILTSIWFLYEDGKISLEHMLRIFNQSHQ